MRRSFVPPVRDEESETQRKAHAKRVRETRRSTQGVTLDEIKSAEQLVKKKQQQNSDPPSTTVTTPTTTTTNTQVEAHSYEPTSAVYVHSGYTRENIKRERDIRDTASKRLKSNCRSIGQQTDTSALQMDHDKSIDVSHSRLNESENAEALVRLESVYNFAHAMSCDAKGTSFVESSSDFGQKADRPMELSSRDTCSGFRLNILLGIIGALAIPHVMFASHWKKNTELVLRASKRTIFRAGADVLQFFLFFVL